MTFKKLILIIYCCELFPRFIEKQTLYKYRDKEDTKVTILRRHTRREIL